MIERQAAAAAANPAAAPAAGADWLTAWSVLAIAAAWTLYLPLGLQYLSYLLAGAAAAAWLWRVRQWPMALQWPMLAVPMLFWLLMLATAAWSTAPVADRWSHAWHYGRMLFMPLIALACPALAARRGLRHFVLASALVGALTILNHWHLLPAGALWSSTVEASGNQRIANSLWLALGVAMALVEAGDARQRPARRLAWLAAAVVTALALTLQDRRTGMVALPALLAVLAIAHQRQRAQQHQRAQPLWRAGALLAGVALLAGLTWQQSPTVQARFAEGVAELRSYQPSGPVATSWGMRLRMNQITLQMVRDAPWLGHGLGSWLTLWHQRAGGGGTELEHQLTPHNEYLLITQQAGLAGLALWLAVLATGWRTAWRAGRAGQPALLVWTALAWAAMFNVAVRDAKFALPLLILAGLAMALVRPGAVDPP